MDWVKQEDEHGCGAAVFAMLTNRTYAGAVATIKTHDRWDTQGVSQHVIDQYLAEDGFAIARKYTHLDGVERDNWPVDPFADAHLCIVTQHGGMGHYVILLRDGTVLDPAVPPEHHPCFLSNYPSVLSVAAVTPVGDSR